jgi:hypothetical protein
MITLKLLISWMSILLRNNRTIRDSVTHPLSESCDQIFVPSDALIVHAQPQNDVYQTIVTKTRGETVQLQQLPGVVFTVDEILGPPEA